MKNDNIRRITDAVSTRQVMEHYGVVFNHRGYAKCPFHTEKTASLAIKNNHYKCFGCGAYGGSIDFVMKYFNLTLPQAIVKIGHDFGIQLNRSRPTYRERAQEADNRRIEDAYQEFKQDIEDNYDWLCGVHRALHKRYARTGDQYIGEILERLGDVLDDFSGEEARNWEMRLFHLK